MGGEIGSGVGRRRILVSVGEAGAVVDVEGAEDAIGKVGVEAYVEGVALVVVEGGVARVYGAGIGIRGGVADGSAGDGADLLGELIGVREVRLA